jgi:HTH-type transcriptional regulator/antitoxin HigA
MNARFTIDCSSTGEAGNNAYECSIRIYLSAEELSPAVIHREEENEHCAALLNELDHKPGKPTPAEQRLAELLTLLIEDFEEKHYSLKSASGVEALEELMEANSLKHKDLVDIFGTPSIISEVLRGKRNTTEHIRKLSRRFHVSPEVFF